MNREDAPHLSDDRFNDLILALGTLREAIKNLNEKNEQLTSGPGGIMELKQTIADKEAELEEDLADHNELVVQTVHMDLHIAKLETEIEKLKSGPGGIMEMKQTIADKEAVIERLTKKCDMQANILRRLKPDIFPGTLFISGVLGEWDGNNMPEKLLVVPAYGVDFSYIYERTEKTTGPEW